MLVIPQIITSFVCFLNTVDCWTKSTFVIKFCLAKEIDREDKVEVRWGPVQDSETADPYDSSNEDEAVLRLEESNLFKP